MIQFVLASSSPRRLSILKQVGISPEVTVSDAEEVKAGSPSDVVMQNALLKGQAVAQSLVGEKKIIIAADTIVVIEGKILGKPQDETEALAMLTQLSGRSHWVYSGIALINGFNGNYLVDFDRTEVCFAAVCQQDLQSYIKTGEPMDKAGAYGIQELGALLVDKINGDYYTVMGLPLTKFRQMLLKWNINIWDSASIFPVL